MTNRYLKYTLSTLLALGLVSCASEDFWDTFDRTADGPINFTVGVEASPSPVQRAMTRSGSSTYSMQKSTKVLLKVDGKWAKITKNDGAISKTVTSTVGDGDGLSFDNDNTLYWDDFGAGDPANATNTTYGLTILGVAVDGKSTVPTFSEGDTWKSLSWTVATDGSNVLDKDILVSKESTYKFSDKASAKLLTFTHPLSKITFNIKAGQGFNSSSFEPTVTLSSATELKNKTTSVYAYTRGSVNISTGVATHDNTTTSAIVTSTGSVVPDGYTIVKEAIVYPDTPFGTKNDDVIAILEAEGNVYFITAEAIRAAIGTSVGHYNAQAGYNYIINITVNKTGIRTTATVEDWNKVESGVVFPVININAGFGTKGTGTAPTGFTSFALWRSESIDKAYQYESTLTGSIGDTPWAFSSSLYWPNHNTHYHFRGVYPINIKDSGNNDVLTVTPNTANSTDVQYVSVSNASYSADAFPSNLMIGMPEFATATNCTNHNLDMSTNGICATEGNINLNFRYVMSQVEVKLSSVENTAANYVDLTNAKVELVNVGKAGKILLKDRSAVLTDDGKQTFELPYVSSTTSYHGTIIPQSLLTSDNKNNKVQFKITVYSDAAKTKVEDIYYADVAPIKVAASGATPAATNAWELGVHYVYNLKITKTQITATASLTDWTTKEATEDVWF